MTASGDPINHERRVRYNAIQVGWPKETTVQIASQPTGRAVSGVTMLGARGDLQYTQDGSGLHIALPSERPNDLGPVFKISGVLSGK